MMLEPLQYLLGAGSGVLVGFTLGLIGGGGSVLAVPLMVYLVGVPSPHVAIGTSAFAVAASAVLNLANHARAGNVNWRCAGMFATAGVIGAYAGSSLGKVFDGQKLLVLFALVMIAVGILMLRGRGNPGTAGTECTLRKSPKVLGYGLTTGVFSGFFGIGGGFLIVPGLVASTGMPMLNAIGSSLLAVTAFGLTTALNYASSGFVDWPLAFIFIAGGVGGGLIGAKVAKRLSGNTGTLSVIFAGVVFAVAGYMLWKSAGFI
jgi:uncharacterized membrane protein YfcA